MKTRVFTLIVSLFITAMAFAYDVKIDRIYYNLDTENRTAIVTSDDNLYYSYSGNIIIPSSISYKNETYSVTSIGAMAFYRCSEVTSITIPNSVTSIGYYAFQGTSWLKNLPDGCVYAGSCLYEYKGKMPENTHIDIKEGTTQICPHAFEDCESLTSITIPNSVTSIGYYAFNGCSGLTSVTIGNSVTSIETSAFEGCSSLSSVTIGNSVTSIGENAFRNCSSLSSISIPNSVTSIGNHAFQSCSSLTSITISEGVTKIGPETFKDCKSLKSIEIPNSVTIIGSSAFEGCSSLTSITIPEGVTEIGGYAFSDCSSLASINIPNGVTTIKDGTFGYCSKLTSITIPNSVTSIEDYAFRFTQLKELVIEATNPPSLSNVAFWVSDNSRKNTTVKVPCSSISTYQTTEGWKDFTNFVGVGLPPLLTINVNDASMGVATITKQNSCEDNIAQVEAKANVGYKFVRWSDGNTENPRKITVTEDMTLTAEFAIDQYQVTLKSNGNGSVTGSGTYDYGTKVTIEAIADKGYHFEKWSDGNTENPRTITVTEDIELSATFELDETPVENVQITSANVYSRNGILHVEGAETDYYVLDMAGRLIYSGRDAEVQLPRGVYLVTIKGEVQKIIL